MIEEQKYLLELIKRVDAFMRENEITYYLYGGSAIGAMRHRGFIPWDDDMDIIVDRTNYYKLASKADKLPDDLGFIGAETDAGFFKVSGFIYDKTNTCSSKSRMFMGGEAMGFTLDVFILDDVKAERVDEHGKALILYEDVMEDAWIYHPDIVKYQEEYFKLKEEQAEKGNQIVTDRLRAELEKDAPCESDKYVTRWCRSKLLVYDKEIFGEPLYVDFEDTKLPVPSQPEAMLRVEYGPSWYMLPVKEDQEIHNFAVVNEISYNNYYRDLSHFISWEEASNTLRSRKAADIKRQEQNNKVKRYRDRFQLKRILMKTGADTNSEELIEMFNAGRYEEFLHILTPLIDGCRPFQTCESERKSIPKNLTGTLMQALILAGRYYDADKIRRFLLVDEEPDDSCAAEAVKMLQHVTDIVANMQDKKLEDVSRLAGSGYAKELESRFGMTLAEHIRARSLLAAEQDREEEDRLLAACEENLAYFPENWDVIKVKADILFARGNKKEAGALYEAVLENSRNGLDVLDVKDKLR